MSNDRRNKVNFDTPAAPTAHRQRHYHHHGQEAQHRLRVRRYVVLPPRPHPHLSCPGAPPDDWGRYASAYAPHEPPGNLNELISTPNFDRLASEGALFLNALVPAPSCTPCRSSLLSGSYFWQTGLGAILEGARWDESIPTFPLELEAKAGYFIGHTYKVWSPGRTANAPIGATRTQYQDAGTSYGFFSHFVTANAPELGVDGAKQILYDETRDNFRSFLAARPEDKPFCYWWGPTNTHRTWEKGSGKALWDIEPDDLEGRMPDFLPDVHEVREDAGDYLGECLAVDAGLGVLLDELEKAGELENTLVVASGDHGIPGMPRAKCNLYDIGCEVALAARWPGNIEPGTVIKDFVNIMDLAPTFCEAGGTTPPSSMTAKSLLPILRSGQSGQIDAARDFVVTGRERHVALARENFLPYPQRCLRTADYIYIINASASSVLPWECARWDPLTLVVGSAVRARPLADGRSARPRRPIEAPCAGRARALRERHSGRLPGL